MVSIYWIFQKINHSTGVELAEVAVAFLSILIMALILVGMRAGLGLDRWIRYRRFEECRLFHSSPYTYRVLSWLGYDQFMVQDKAAPEEFGGLNVDELLAIMETPKRRGRRPTHSLERWVRVVLAWENRDPLRNTMTLPQFLCEEFDTNADGTPRESESNFYEYRQRILTALKKNAKSKKAIPGLPNSSV